MMYFSGKSSLGFDGHSISEPYRLAVNPATYRAYDLVMYVEKALKH